MTTGSHYDRSIGAESIIPKTRELTVSQKIDIVAKRLDELGISVVDDTGKFKELHVIMTELVNKWSGCVCSWQSLRVDEAYRYTHEIPLMYRKKLYERCAEVYYDEFHLSNDNGVKMVRWASTGDNDGMYTGYEPNESHDDDSQNTALDDFLASFKIIKRGGSDE